MKREEEVEVQATQGAWSSKKKKDNLLKREIVGIAKGRKVFNCGNKQRNVNSYLRVARSLVLFFVFLL